VILLRADRFLPEARPYAVENELDGQGRKEDAEHAGEDVRPISPKRWFIRGEEEGEQVEQQDRE
jgi:sarcosine oxidase gamma subunit